jgi:hypothetical protein
MYGPYGPMMGDWSQMWLWMWQMQLVWVLPLLIVVALVAYSVGARAGGPKTPSAPSGK